MNDGTTISGEVGGLLAAEVDRLAAKLGQTRQWIVAQAVEQYVTAELELLDSLDEADMAIDRGEFYTQEQVAAWSKERRRPDRAA